MIRINWYPDNNGQVLFCTAICDCGEWESPARMNPREICAMAGAHIATAHYPGRHRARRRPALDDPDSRALMSYDDVRLQDLPESVHHLMGRD